MPIIQGTDGDDVLYGDGKSQINGGKGNDTIYPYGGVHEEVILEPGNETYDVRNGNGPQILVPSNDPAAGRDTYINLTNQIWSINGRTVPSLTIFDPYGGVDRLIDSKNDSIGINVIHGSDRNEYLKGGGTFNVYPNFGTDYVDSANDIRFQDWGKVNITIKGTTGEVVIDSSKLTYKNIKNWSFSNGEFNINGSREGETFNFWGSDKQITVAGGGGGDTFQVMNSGSNKVIILDFDSDDTIRLWNWFLTGNDLIINQQLRGYSDAELKALIEITPNQIAGTTTLTLKTLKPSQNPAIYTLNGNYELTSVSRTSNNDVDIRLNPIPIYGDGKSAIIKGTDGNDIIYGDGVGQIKAGSGDDLIFPSGKPHQEVWLDPGNDTIDLKNSINSAAQIYSPSDDLSLGNTYVNLTKNDWSIDNKIIRSRTILDPYGGEDKVINSIYPDRIMLSLWGTIRNEFLKSDDYATLNILGPKFNQDTKLGPGDVHFFNWKQRII